MFPLRSSSKPFLVDTYLAQAEPELPQRAQWIADAYRHYRFTPKTGIVIGSGALALHGIDGRPPLKEGQRRSPFDLDVVTVPSQIRQAKEIGRRFDDPTYDPALDPFFNLDDGGENYHNHGAWPLDALLKCLVNRDTEKEFRELGGRSQIVRVAKRAGDIAVLKPEVALASKLATHYDKDVFGVIYAHASAHRQSLPIIQNRDWLRTVGLAVSAGFRISQSLRPDWFIDTYDKRGKLRHPAFAFIDR